MTDPALHGVASAPRPPDPTHPAAAPSTPLRVALVCERAAPDLGGVENVAWKVAEGLARAGDAVTLVTRSGDAPAGVTARRIEGTTGWKPLRVLGFSRAAARATREGFDVVQSFSRTRHQDVFRTGGGSHADYLERCHGPLGVKLRRISPRHVVQLRIERDVFSDPSQTLLCNSDFVRDQIARRYNVPPERFVVIRNGVDLDRFHPRRRGDEGARLRGELGAGSQTVWLFAGSGFARKGLDVALAALAATRDRSACLWIAGRDDAAPWQRLVQRLGLHDRVRFLGARRDLEGLYAAADAFLLPTRYDAFANVCLEAAAAGLPVVTSGSNGAAEIVRSCGIVVEDADDASGFARAMEALGDPTARTTRGKAARAVAEAHSWHEHVARLRALYARLSPRR